ncbi:unnamed protein product, partial [Didymodactylos carnosus]
MAAQGSGWTHTGTCRKVQTFYHLIEAFHAWIYDLHHAASRCGYKKNGNVEEQETSSATIDDRTTSTSLMSTPSLKVSDANKTVWTTKDRQRLKRFGGGCAGGGYSRGDRSDDACFHWDQQ